MRLGLAAVDGFAEVMNMTNHPGSWDAQLTWYSLNVTYKVFCFCLKHDLEIYNFRPTWSWLRVKVLATWVKFPEPPGTCTAPLPFVQPMLSQQAIFGSLNYFSHMICTTNLHMTKILQNFWLLGVLFCPVDCSCRIHRPLLCRGGKTPSQWMSWIWH